MKYVQKSYAKSKRTVPANYAKGIGRIVVRWAYLETLLQRTLYDLLELPIALGRLAVVEKRAQDQLELIMDVAAFLELKLPTEQEIKDFKRLLEETKRNRDILSHGTWQNDENGWYLFDTRGAWNQQEVPMLAKMKRKIVPKGLHMDSVKLGSIDASIDKAIELCGELRDNFLTQLAASKQTPQ